MYIRRRARKGQKNLLRLGDFLEKTLKRKKISIDVMDHEILKAWGKAVGPQISTQSDPYKFKGGTVYVRVSTPAWMHELQFMKHEIVDRLNSAIKDKPITAVYFSLGHRASLAHDTDDREESKDFSKYPLKEREKRLIADATSSIGDKELKTLVKRVMKKEIIKRKMSGDG